MSDRVQDLTNHRKVAVACKNYTDKEVKKAKDELITLFSKNTVETEDHTNELTYQITAPSGAKLLQLMSVGGNSVKYAPSSASNNTTENLKVIPENTYTANVDTIGNTTTKYNPTFASDDTTALIKTMPATVYDLDVNKIYGASEVSENLLVVQDVAETTAGGITYKVENGVITFITGTASNGGMSITFDLINPLPSDSYYYKNFGTGTRNIGIRLSDNTTVWGANSGASYNISANIVRIYFYFSEGNSVSNEVYKPMLVSGTTAPTEFKPGFEGINNLELSGLKVDGANLWSLQTSSGEKYEYNASTCYMKILATSWISLPNTITLEKGSYIMYRSVNRNQLFIYKEGTNDVVASMNGSYYVRFTLTETTNINRIASWNGDWEGYFAIVRDVGQTVPTTYQPYIAPTTKTIDLSTILYDGNPLFEGNSLKAIGTAKDYITPYVAHKGVGTLVINNNTRFSWIANNLMAGTIQPSQKAQTGGSVQMLYVSNNTNIDRITGEASGGVYITFKTAYSSQDELKNAMIGTIVEYQLATPIEVSIDWSSTLRGIQGYSNGSIIATNTYDMPVSSEIRYNSVIENDYADSVVFSGNLLNINDVAETTTNGITYKVENGIIYLKGTCSANFEITLTSNMSFNGNYYFSAFNSGYDKGTANLNNRVIFGSEYWNISSNDFGRTITMTNIYGVVKLAIISGNVYTNGVFKPMLIKGSTAPTTYRPYIAPITKPIPSEIKALDGYDYCTESTTNFINLNSKKFIQNVKKHTITSNQSYLWISGTYLYATINVNGDAKLGMTYIYTNNSNITKAEYANNGNIMFTFSTAYSSEAELKQAMIGVIIYYELATPVETDISSYLANFNPILTNNNYTNYEVISHNGNALPNKISYIGTIKETLVDSVTVNSMNVWDEQWEIGGYNFTNGDVVAFNNRIRSKSTNYISVIPNATYYIHCGNTNAKWCPFFYDKNYNYVGSIGNSYVDQSYYTNTTYTVPSNAYYLRFYLTSVYGTTYNNDVCINVSNVNLNGTYKPYKNDTRNLPTTTSDGYGVNSDAHNLRVFSDYEGNAVSKRYTNVNSAKLKDLTWAKYSDNFFGTITDGKHYTTNVIPVLCLQYNSIAWVNRNNAQELDICDGFDVNAIIIRDLRFNNTTTFKNHFTNNDDLYYELADASKTEADIDDFDFFFDVEEGDIITFNNPYAQQVYATYSFLIKEAKSNE